MNVTLVLNNAKVFRSGVFSRSSVSISLGNGVSRGGTISTMDASSFVILPGFVDVHVHLREPGFSYKETIRTGSLAAAHGGYTTVCAMPNLNPVPDSMETLQPELDAIQKDAVIRVLPYGAITKGEQGGELADLDAMAPYVVAFSDDGKGVQDRDMMRRAMMEAKRLGKLIVAHCEDNSLLRGGYIHDGAYAKAHGHRGICSESEWRPIQRDLELVRETGCGYHVCHISTKESVDLIRKAKAEGKLVGWSSSKFPCELAEAFDLNVMYPENQAAGIAANRDGEIMCKAAEDLGFDNDICGYARISLAYAAGKRASRKVDLETGEYVINPNSGKPLKDENGNVVIDPETGKPKYYGRFNQGVVTINLVDVALSSGGNFEKFWKIFDERLDLCHRALQARHKRLLGTPSDAAPILWQYGALARLKKGEKIDKLLFGGYSTISLGYAGLYECVKYMTGKSHTDAGAKPFALSVMQHMNDKCNAWKKAENMDYSLYGTPLESTTYKFAKCLQKRFGIVKGITDKNYITNSYHVHVSEPIDAFTKLKFEADFQRLSPGGAISYVEVPNMQDNLEAVMSVLQFIYDNIMYAELNTKSDYCQVCGYDGEIKIVEDDGKLVWECPKCGNRDQNKLNVARRTCGYIGTQFWNQGRTQEIKDRVLHL